MASAGEICCVYGADGRCNLLAQELGCKLGMWEYREQFVRPFARLLADAPKVPVAVILEPDVLLVLSCSHRDRCQSNPNFFTQFF